MNLGMMERKPMPDLESLQQTEQCPEFRSLKDVRLIMGALRYGLMGKKDVRLDRIGNCFKRLNEYVKDGNKEHLLDIANLCELEWVEQNHPPAHYNPTDDCAHHCGKVHETHGR